ncbi:hypothetical protein [Sphingomonas phage Kimi]|nr:hypothetical protein [Sphingomonas phage Kimi]
MSIQPQAARKEIFARINTVWETHAEDLLGVEAELRFQGDEKPGLPGSDKFWGRASTQLVTTRNSAHIMSNEPGASPAEFTSNGLVFIQLFAPMKTGAYGKMELLAEQLQRCFMAANTNSGVWFRNPRINELTNDNTWYRWNVVSEYQFNQVKGT